MIVPDGCISDLNLIHVTCSRQTLRSSLLIMRSETASNSLAGDVRLPEAWSTIPFRRQGRETMPIPPRKQMGVCVKRMRKRLHNAVRTRQNPPEKSNAGKILSTTTKVQLHRNVSIERQGGEFREMTQDLFPVFSPPSVSRIVRCRNSLVQISLQQPQCGSDGTE